MRPQPHPIAHPLTHPGARSTACAAPVAAGAVVAWALLCAGPAAAGDGVDLRAEAQLALVAPEGAAARPAGTAHAQWERLDTLNADGLQRRFGAGLRVQHSPSGCPDEVCDNGAQAELTAWASLSHYAYGRLTLGRLPSLRGELALKASAFGAATVGANRCAALLRSPCPRLDPFGALAEGAAFGAWTPAAQLSTHGGVTTGTAQLRGDLAGGRLWLALSRGSQGHWQLPLGLSMPAGRFRLFAHHARGRTADGMAQHSSLGLSTPVLGGEFRAQLSRQRLAPDAASASRKLALGLHRPLTLHWTPFVDVAVVRRDDGSRWQGLDAGLRWVW